MTGQEMYRLLRVSLCTMEKSRLVSREEISIDFLVTRRVVYRRFGLLHRANVLWLGPSNSQRPPTCLHISYCTATIHSANVWWRGPSNVQRPSNAHACLLRKLAETTTVVEYLSEIRCESNESWNYNHYDLDTE